MIVAGPAGLQLQLATRAPGVDEDLSIAIVDHINKATGTVRVVTQQLEEESIVKALLAARLRGCKVRVLLEEKYLSESGPVDDPWTASGRNEQNRHLFNVLLRSDIDVRLDRRSELLHSNFIVVDMGDAGQVVVLTSANMTSSGARLHWDANVTINNEDVVRAFSREFDAMWRSSSQAGDEPLQVPVQNIPVKVVFGPVHQPEMEVMKQIAKARQKVRFAMYTFSNSSGIDDILSMASSQSGINVAGVLDEQIRNQRWVASHALEAAGVSIRWLGSDIQKLHHKLVTIDDKIVIVGTFNFTRSARFSHETVIVIGGINSDSAEQRELVNTVTNEIDRLIAIGRPSQ